MITPELVGKLVLAARGGEKIEVTNSTLADAACEFGNPNQTQLVECVAALWLGSSLDTVVSPRGISARKIAEGFNDVIEAVLATGPTASCLEKYTEDQLPSVAELADNLGIPVIQMSKETRYHALALAIATAMKDGPEKLVTFLAAILLACVLCRLPSGSR